MNKLIKIKTGITILCLLFCLVKIDWAFKIKSSQFKPSLDRTHFVYSKQFMEGGEHRQLRCPGTHKRESLRGGFWLVRVTA